MGSARRVLRVIAASVLAVTIAACGNDKPNINPRRDRVMFFPPKGAPTAAEQEFRSCLRQADIKVVIPIQGYAPLSARVAPGADGVADSFFWIGEHPTQAARSVARECASKSK